MKCHTLHVKFTHSIWALSYTETIFSISEVENVHNSYLLYLSLNKCNEFKLKEPYLFCTQLILGV